MLELQVIEPAANAACNNRLTLAGKNRLCQRTQQSDYEECLSIVQHRWSVKLIWRYSVYFRGRSLR